MTDKEFDKRLDKIRGFKYELEKLKVFRKAVEKAMEEQKQ